MDNLLKIKGYGFVAVFLISVLITLSVSIFRFENYQNTTLFSKTFIFGCYAVIFTTCILWQIIKTKNVFHIASADVVVSCLLIFVLIKSFLRDDFSFSLRFYDLISVFIFYVFLRFFINSKTTVLYVIWGITMGVFINTLYGFGQFFNFFKTFHSEFDVTGSFFNPAPFAGLIAVGSVLNAFLIFYGKSFFKKFSYKNNSITFPNFLLYANVLMLLFNTSLLIILQSRASWLAFLTGILFLLFARTKPMFSSAAKKRLYSTLIIFVVILCGLGFYSLRKNSADGRLLIWKISSEIIKDFPLTGVGLDKFKAHYMPHQANYFLQHDNEQEMLLSDNVVYAFNDFIQFTVEQGLVGLFLLLFLLFVTSKKTQNPEGVAGFSLLISLSVFACFSYPLQILPLKMLGVFGCAICSFGHGRKVQIFPKPFLNISVILMSLFFIIFQINTLRQLHTAYSLWKTAMSAYFSTNFKESVSYFQQAYPILKTDGEFLMHYGKALSLNNEYKKSNEILHLSEKQLNNTVVQIALGDNYKELKNYIKAEKHYKTASYMTPNRLYPHYLLAIMYEASGNIKKAKQQAEILLKMPVKVPSMAVFEMQEEMDTTLKTKQFKQRVSNKKN